MEVTSSSRTGFAQAAHKRIRRLLQTLLLSVPVYRDAATSTIARVIGRASTRTVRAFPVATVLLLGAAASYRAGGQVAAALLAACSFAVLGAWTWPRLWDAFQLKRALARRRSPNGRPPAHESLRRLGLDADTISLLLAGTSEAERTIAEFDQNNRMLSHVGPIPLFTNTLVDGHAFHPRSRNRTRIVVAWGGLAVRKDYTVARRFANEVRVLDTLEGLDGVPSLLKTDAAERVTYQTFFPGRNLGSLLADAGASVSMQYQLARAFGRPEESSAQVLRDTVIRALRQVVDRDFLAAVQRLVVDVHRKGVLLRDVKHGNVLVCEEGPRLCDFDLSRVFPRTSAAATQLRTEERERVNYLFGGDLLTPDRFRDELAAWIARNPDLEYPGAYFGKGYRFGPRLTPDDGTGKWHVVRRHLPSIRGGHVIDLSGGTGLVALEMLRGGARSVVAHERDERLTELAHLHHRFVEFVDNRAYDFSTGAREVLYEEPAGEVALVIALRTPHRPGRTVWEWAKQFIRRHGTRVRSVAIECTGAEPRSRDPRAYLPPHPEVTHSLAQTGFVDHHVVALRLGDTMLTIAHRKSD